MPMRLLQRLACRAPPLIVTDPEEIEKLSALLAAELIIAIIPPPIWLNSGHLLYVHAELLSITEKGAKAMRQMHDLVPEDPEDELFLPVQVFVTTGSRPSPTDPLGFFEPPEALVLAGLGATR